MALSSSTISPHFMLSGWATNDFGVSKKKGTCGGVICLQRNSFEPWKLCTHSARVPSNRGHRLIVAANPTEAAVIPNKPLITKEDLVAYFDSGCKPKTEWRIGTEHEKFGFELGSLHPMRYGQIAELLNGIAERFGWDKIMEGDNVIGLKQGKQKVTLEPGGQLELSGAPLETLHQTCAEINSHLCQVKAVAGTMGIGFLAIGFQPKWEDKDTPLLPMARFGIARKFFSKRGSLALDVMHRTCTVQVATALFANSPFTKEEPNGFLSMRSYTWTDIDERRTGMIPFVFNDSFGFERYIDYALDVPMVCVYRQKKYIDCAGMSFRVFHLLLNIYFKVPEILGFLL
nr:glutamate--cysteine ligase, chloroplastic [Quercus suber]